MLYRVFPYVAGAEPHAPGGSLYVARERQGSGRHDNPESYGALYLTRSAESAVAERLQAFRGRTVGDALFARPGGAVYALASLDDPEAGGLVDLDDPDELSARRLRPSQVASRHRGVTQPIALALFDEGADGLSWWSVLEASWTNVTLFAERAAASLAETAPPEPLAVTHPAVRAAAEEIGVTLA